MSTNLRSLLMRELDQLRHEPIDKRIRATLGGETVVDSVRALLVWEPKRVVPTYAVPVGDVRAELVPVPAETPEEHDGVPIMGGPELGGRRVYDPSIPFAVHTTDGSTVAVQAAGRQAAGFLPADPDLDGYVILDFAGFDAWFEEDEPNVGHPRDPFHRIDIVHSSRRIRIERDGVVLAESTAARLLFEPPLPVRYYLPPEDVRMDLLQPSETRTWCAYKGQASYWSLEGEDDVAWSYPAPLREAAEITDHVTFFNERVDVVVDGERLERPVTPWSKD